MSSTALGSSITGSTKPPAALVIEPMSVDSAMLVATPAIVSPNCKTMDMVTFREITDEISKPNATPHIVEADKLRRRLRDNKLVTDLETMSAVAAGSPEDCEPSM